MAFSTGSGDYLALMAAVLAHAIADGWTTTGGNWPISKGNVRGVNWSTRTISATDYLSGNAVNFTERLIDLSIGSSGANATSNASAQATSVQIRNLQVPIQEWFIFSDPDAGDYIHVVMRQTNGYTNDCWAHFSFGELDKGGMGYTSIAYAASSCRRPYVALPAGSNTNTNQSYDWNCGINGNWSSYMSGRLGFQDAYDRQTSSGLNSLVFMIHPTVSPVVGGGGWIQPDQIGTQQNLYDSTSPSASPQNSIATILTNSSSMSFSFNTVIGHCQAQPYSGAISLSGIPFILLNGSSPTAQGMFLGMFPGIRICSLDTYNPKDEVTLASDTWFLAPILRKTTNAECLQSTVVASGNLGYAYKKVV
jgi:hypothetical protein